MKQALPLPAIIGVVVVLVAIVGFFFMKTVTAEPNTPRPDPAMFGYGPDGAPKKAPAGQ
jgi:zinc transporter ZupT